VAPTKILLTFCYLVIRIGFVRHKKGNNQVYFLKFLGKSRIWSVKRPQGVSVTYLLRNGIQHLLYLFVRSVKGVDYDNGDNAATGGLSSLLFITMPSLRLSQVKCL
jgi:hypothetical protein